MTKKINKDMTFADALNIAGQKGAEIMANNGLHCIGCHIAATESIAEGCAAHGLSEEDADKMVEDINKSIENNNSEDKKEEK